MFDTVFFPLVLQVLFTGVYFASCCLNCLLDFCQLCFFKVIAFHISMLNTLRFAFNIFIPSSLCKLPYFHSSVVGDIFVKYNKMCLGNQYVQDRNDEREWTE